MSSIAKISAYLLSLLMHPLFMLVYMFLIYLLVNPYLFPHSSGKDLGLLFLVIFFSSVLIPGIAILLMVGLGMIESIHMKDKTDRIGPLIIISVSYLWLFLNFRTHSAIPISYAQFILGALIAVFIAFFINNFSKISLHAVGLGGLFSAFLMLLVKHGQGFISFAHDGMMITVNSVLVLAVLLILIGATLTGRIHLKAHRNQDIMDGFSVGIIGQILALFL